MLRGGRGTVWATLTRPIRAPGWSTNTGVYLAILQLVFTLGWTVYVI